MTDSLRHALHQYEQIGPAKMERSDLNIIRDAAASRVMPMVNIEKLKAAIDAYEQMICIDENEVALECMRLVLAAQSGAESRQALIECCFTEANRAYAAETRASELEVLLEECETVVEPIISGYLDYSRVRTLLAKLKARSGDAK